MKIEVTEDEYTLNSLYSRGSFEPFSFDSVDAWRGKEITKRLEKPGSHLELDRIREEVDNELKQLSL